MGYASHLFGDVYVALYYWRPEEFTFLLWPVLPPYPYDEAIDLTGLVGEVTATPSILLAFAAAALIGVGFLVQFLRAPWYPSTGPQA